MASGPASESDSAENAVAPILESVEPGSEAETELKSLIAEHQKETGSRKASAMLADWEQYRAKFVRIFPVEYRNALKAKGNI